MRTVKNIWRGAILGIAAAVIGVSLSTLLHLPAQSRTSVPMAGGDTTLFTRTSQAYAQPAPNLDDYWADRHAVGDLAFEAAFVTPPANVNSGLGPLFNGASCVACHISNGRGLPEKGQRVVRVSQLTETAPDTTEYEYAREALSPIENTPPVAGHWDTVTRTRCLWPCA